MMISASSAMISQMVRLGKILWVEASHWFHFKLALVLKVQIHKNSVFTAWNPSRGGRAQLDDVIFPYIDMCLIT